MRREKITAATDADDAYGHRRDRGLDPSNNVNVIPIAACGRHYSIFESFEDNAAQG